MEYLAQMVNGISRRSTMGISAESVIGIARKYTDDSVKGLGTIAGKNCTIKSIETVEDGKKVTFEWTADDGTKKTSSMVVANGEKGDRGEKGEKGDTGEVAISFVVVEALPTRAESGVMYLVPKETASEQDIYDEYMYIGNAWEHIGTTEINLSDYYTKTEIDDRLDYSEEETVVGKWINGKTLYRRVFTKTFSHDASLQDTSIGTFNNINEIKIVNVTGSSEGSGSYGAVTLTNPSNQSATTQMWVDKKTGIIVYKLGQSVYTNQNVTVNVIIEYYKNED